MTHLIRSELLRVVWRRAYRVACLIFFLLIASISILHFLGSDNSERARIRSEQAAKTAEEECLQLNAAIQGKALAPDEARIACQTAQDDPAFSFRDRVPAWITGMAPWLMLVAIGFGAFHAGSLISTGDFRILATWEPRRERIAPIQALVVGVVSGMVVLAGMLAFVGLHYGVASVKGTVTGTNGHLWMNVSYLVLCTSFLAAWGSIVGATLAFATRSGVIATTAALGYFFLVDPLAASRAPFDRWRLGRWVEDLVERTSDGTVATRFWAISILAGVLVTLLWTARLSVVRRDII